MAPLKMIKMSGPDARDIKVGARLDGTRIMLFDMQGRIFAWFTVADPYVTDIFREPANRELIKLLSLSYHQLLDIKKRKRNDVPELQ